MKIQSKLIFAFLVVSLPLLIITNIIFYGSEKKVLSRNILNHLESVASIQQHRIHEIAQQNAERLRLVASRTQLRLSLEKFLASADPQHQVKMNQILRDAQASIPDFSHIYVYSPEGMIVASNVSVSVEEKHLHEGLFMSGREKNRVDLFYLDADQNFVLHLAGPLYLDNIFLGVIVIEAKVDNMVKAISDYTGLGQTGETVLAAKNNNDDTVFIMPTRFDRRAALRMIIPKDDRQIPINRAFSGKGELLTDATDYRKVPVLAATRYIEDFDWGIVVKIDKDEAFAPLARMRGLLFSILTVAGCLIIFLSCYLAKGITRPIVRLTGVAHSIADDRFAEQADESQKDEVGVLAAAFNKMTGKLISTRKILEKNIDELLAANQQLMAGEERYREIFNTPSDAIFMHDADTGKIIDVNQGMLDMFGYTYEEALQIGIGSLASGEHPYTMEEVGRKIHNTVSSGPQSFEWLSRKRDGTLFWIEVTLKCTEFSGQRYVIAVVRNTNDRKLAEKSLAEEKERLAVTLRSIGDGVITTDISGNVVLLNKIAEKLTGWSNEEAVGRPLEEVFHIINEQTREICENPAKKVITSGQIVGLANHTILVTKDGKELSIADSGAPILDDQSNIIGVVLVFRNVTEQIRTEKELLKVKKLESIGVLAGGIAHDFNNILTAILGNVNLAALDPHLSPGTKNLLDETEKASHRAKALTQQLLTFAKGGEPVKEAASLESVIKDSANFILHGEKVACRYEIPEGLWLVDIDKGQMSQVIQNIVLNASHAMPEGGTIQISCKNIDPLHIKSINLPRDKKFVEITITDSGIGIPANLIEKIFDPYFSTKQKGSGLGLAISYSIITKHNGQVVLKSTPGVGTTFTLYIPASTQQHEKEERAESLEEGDGKAKIMVMDDEELVREIAKTMLTRLGHEVVLAHDGAEALNLYKEYRDSDEPIDIVIMDLTIPGGMGGEDAVKEVLTFDSGAKVIVSSGYSNDPIMANFQEYGFCAAIVKPYLLQELTKVINQVREQRQQWL